MATPPVRRSARLRSMTPATEPQNKAPWPSANLISVSERDETSDLRSPPNPRIILASPQNHPTSTTPVSESHSKSLVKTPNTTGDLKPGLEEMHPSKVHQIISKQPDSGLRLGFKPIQNISKYPSDAVTATPTKSRLSLTDPLDSPSFGLQFSCEDSQLSEEAKKLMENIREDASRIKAQMIIEQNAQRRKDAEAEQMFGERNIAKAKGIVGRFSNAHMVEFKKMDSIAGHPSAFRARPDRIQPPPAKSLKRTRSKACLDDTSSPAKPITATSSSAKFLAADSVKRSKTSNPGSATSRTHLSKDYRCESKPEPMLAKLDLQTVITPIKPTVVRASSVKHPNTAKNFSSIPHSPSTRSIVAPRTPQTEFNPKFKTKLPSLTNLKSILRRRQPLFSTDLVKIASGTHVAPPSKIFDIPEVPTAKKHVEFSASTKLRHVFQDFSPTSIKNLPDKPTGTGTISYPTLPVTTPPHDRKAEKAIFGNITTPTIRTVASFEVDYPQPAFPADAVIPHGIINKKRHREPDDDDVENKAPEDSTGDERSLKRMKPNPTVATKIHTPSSIKSRPVQHGTPGISTPRRSTQKSKGVLSMSRLNMLSKPKVRR
ncbi:hypothetical protein PABG_02088 [Paracoccidioides brasiliensis Pb03]|nr:hypothetical protein PABG_02088 [Paracoccidioides brasiliensis Pb03]